MSKHTPTPWHIAEYGIDNPSYTIVMGGKPIAKICSPRENGEGNNIPKQDEAEANAAFIVEACNSHDSLTQENKALREALLSAQAHLEYTGYGDKWERECALTGDDRLDKKIEAALAMNKGEG